MANFAESFGYSNAFLFDTDGSLLFQLKPNLELGSNLLTGPLKESELAEVFDRVRTLLQTEVSDYQMYPGRSEPAAFIASPVFSNQGRIVGFMALELSNEQVFRVLKDYSGLGETGEAMVAMRHGQDEFIYVAPPRNSQETALEVPGEDSAMPREPPCRRPSKVSAVMARQSTTEVSRSLPPGRISPRSAGEWWSSRMTERRLP